MSLIHHKYPFFESERSLINNSIFNDFKGNFFNMGHLVPKHRHNHLLHHYRYNPFNSLERKIEKVTDKDVFKLVDFCPKINIIEDNDKYYIQAELPGMTKNEIKIEISKDRIITISGERKSIKESDNKKNGKNKYGKRNKKYSKVECSYGKFERSFNIPENVDLNNIKAKMENGVLEVTFDKIESTKNKIHTIQIQ